MCANGPASPGAQIQSVLVTLAKKAKQGAMPHLSHAAFWDVDHFRVWAERALVAIRELCRDFQQPGGLVWRAQAAQALIEIRADAPSLFAWLAERPAADHLPACPDSERRGPFVEMYRRRPPRRGTVRHRAGIRQARARLCTGLLASWRCPARSDTAHRNFAGSCRRLRDEHHD